MPAAEAILEKRASASPTSMASPSFRCPILSVLTKWADRVVRDGPSTIPADRRHPVLARAPRVYFWMVRLLTRAPSLSISPRILSAREGRSRLAIARMRSISSGEIGRAHV